MRTDDVIPTTDAAFGPWYHNIATKIPTYSVTFALTTAELARVAAALPFVAGIFNAVDAADQEKREWHAFQNLVLYGSDDGTMPGVPSNMPPAALSPILAGLVEFLRGLIQRIKRNVNYTAVIGQDLGIVAGSTPAPAVPKPTGSVSSDGNFTATVKFKKAGHGGVEVWRQRAGESVWVRIATDSYSPYVDNAAPLVPGQPEERRYRLRYLDKDEPVGEFSDVFSCVVGP